METQVLIKSIKQAESESGLDGLESLYRTVGRVNEEKGMVYLERDAFCKLKAARRNGQLPDIADLTKVSGHGGYEPNPPKGVGDFLHDVIVERFKVMPSEKCDCASLINAMNEGGIPWAVSNFQAIVEHLAGNTDKLKGKYKLVLKVPGGMALARREAGRMLGEAMERYTKAKDGESSDDG